LTQPPSILREPGWIGSGDDAFFAWYHDAPAAPRQDCVAVLCGPVGWEYTRAHRAIRHLADRFAASGIPALRFDYHGIGDSPGSDLDPGRLETWQGNIRAAIARAQALAGTPRVCLVGIRLGATLAALVAAGQPVERLVLWNPCVRGKPYVRELQAIAASAAAEPSREDGLLESAGFVMTAETVAAVRAIDLQNADLGSTGRVLVLARENLAADDSYAKHLSARGVPNDFMIVPGWSGMMAEHQFTVVPEVALDAIVKWVHETRGAMAHASSQPPPATSPAAGAGPGPDTLALRAPGAHRIEERACHFGADRQLFGILTREGDDRDRTAVLIFNAGAVHHVGPNRVYVALARNLAAQGFACLRFDLEGIGDSVLRGPGRENHPYPAHATADARAALEFMKSEYGYTRFVGLGLCSGAHTAFHAGLAESGEEFGELILINPLTFYWTEGMSLETVSKFEDLQAYRKSMRDPARWLKLLRGDVNFARLLEVAMDRPRTLARSYYDALCEMLLPDRAPRLSQDLRRLLEHQRRVTFLIAEGDPGRDILMAGAKHTASRGLKSGRIRLEMIPGGDHTFSRLTPREALLERLAAHLAASRAA
jgi:alpha-beta hydrolase superfamily lysophospholipase